MLLNAFDYAPELSVIGTPAQAPAQPMCGLPHALKTLQRLFRKKEKPPSSHNSVNVIRQSNTQATIMPLSTRKVTDATTPGRCFDPAYTYSTRAPTSLATLDESGEPRCLLIDEPRIFQAHFNLFPGQVVGSGMSGKVVLAACSKTGDLFAVKRLKLTAPVDTPEVHREHKNRTVLRLAKTEVKAHRGLNHPNVVKLVDVCETPGEHEAYFVTELGKGGELFSYVQKKGRLPELEAASLLLEMLDALVYLHYDAHVVHRDLKLENWVFSAGPGVGPLKLIDFGLACPGFDPEAGQRMAQCLGTAYYCAPEVALRKPYNEKCDMWSLGVIAFMLIAGRPPIKGSSDKRVLEKIRDLARQAQAHEEGGGNTGVLELAPADRWEGISSPCRSFVQSLLTFDPEARLSALEAREHPFIRQMAELKEREEGRGGL